MSSTLLSTKNKTGLKRAADVAIKNREQQDKGGKALQSHVRMDSDDEGQEVIMPKSEKPSKPTGPPRAKITKDVVMIREDLPAYVCNEGPNLKTGEGPKNKFMRAESSGLGRPATYIKRFPIITSTEDRKMPLDDYAYVELMPAPNVHFENYTKDGKGKFRDMMVSYLKEHEPDPAQPEYDSNALACDTAFGLYVPVPISEFSKGHDPDFWKDYPVVAVMNRIRSDDTLEARILPQNCSSKGYKARMISDAQKSVMEELYVESKNSGGPLSYRDFLENGMMREARREAIRGEEEIYKVYEVPLVPSDRVDTIFGRQVAHMPKKVKAVEAHEEEEEEEDNQAPPPKKAPKKTKAKTTEEEETSKMEVDEEEEQEEEEVVPTLQKAKGVPKVPLANPIKVCAELWTNKAKMQTLGQAMSQVAEPEPPKKKSQPQAASKPKPKKHAPVEEEEEEEESEPAPKKLAPKPKKPAPVEEEEEAKPAPKKKPQPQAPAKSKVQKNVTKPQAEEDPLVYFYSNHLYDKMMEKVANMKGKSPDFYEQRDLLAALADVDSRTMLDSEDDLTMWLVDAEEKIEELFARVDAQKETPPERKLSTDHVVLALALMVCELVGPRSMFPPMKVAPQAKKAPEMHKMSKEEIVAYRKKYDKLPPKPMRDGEIPIRGPDEEEEEEEEEPKIPEPEQVKTHKGIVQRLYNLGRTVNQNPKKFPVSYEIMFDNMMELVQNICGPDCNPTKWFSEHAPNTYVVSTLVYLLSKDLGEEEEEEEEE